MEAVVTFTGAGLNLYECGAELKGICEGWNILGGPVVMMSEEPNSQSVSRRGLLE